MTYTYAYTWSPKDRDGNTLFDFEFEVDCHISFEDSVLLLDVEDLRVDGSSLWVQQRAEYQGKTPLEGFGLVLEEVLLEDDEFLRKAAMDQGWVPVGGGNDPDEQWVRSQ